MDPPHSSWRRRSILKRPSESISLLSTTPLPAEGEENLALAEECGDTNLRKRVSFGHSYVKEFQNLSVSENEDSNNIENQSQYINMDISLTNLNTTFVVENYNKPERGRNFWGQEKDVTFCLPHRDESTNTGDTRMGLDDMNISFSDLSLFQNVDVFSINETFHKSSEPAPKDKTMRLPIEMDLSMNKLNNRTFAKDISAENFIPIDQTVYGGEMLIHFDEMKTNHKKPLFQSNTNCRPLTKGTSKGFLQQVLPFGTLKTPNRNDTFLIQNNNQNLQISKDAVSTFTVSNREKENMPLDSETFMDKSIYNTKYEHHSVLEDQQEPLFHNSIVNVSFDTSKVEANFQTCQDISRDFKKIHGHAKVKLCEKVKVELINMPEDDYSSFKELYQDCFHPNYFNAIDVHKSAICKLNVCLISVV